MQSEEGLDEGQALGARGEGAMSVVLSRVFLCGNTAATRLRRH